MILSKIAIRRPVFALMVILGLLTLGGFGFKQLSVELFPDVEFPVVVITATYPGASPETMETEVIIEIEDAVNPISGVRHIESTCLEGYAFSVVWFELEVDDDIAAQEVREKLAIVKAELPDDVKDVIVQKWDPQTIPVLSLVIAGDYSPRQLTYFAKEIVKKRIESIAGVGNVELIGGEEREILVELRLDNLEAVNLSLSEVERAVASANLEIPGGIVKQGGRDYTIRTLGRLTSVAQIENLVIKTIKGRFIRLKDIATIKDTTAELRSLSRLNGERAVGLNVIKTSGGNVVKVADAIRAELAEIKQLLPKDVEIVIPMDNSQFTRDAVDDVVVNMIYGSILATLVIFLFLADIRPTIISGLAIPIAIISTFAFMNWFGFSLNFMTLLGLSLAVGLLIDDAIVVIENIYRHFSYGKEGGRAADDATSEISLAVLAATLSIVVVFVPVAYMKGIVGRFFFAFGITVAISVLVSLFVAFWLTPMLSSRWLKGETKVHKKGTRNPIFVVTNTWNRFFGSLGGVLKVVLSWALGHRLLVVLFSIAVFALSLMIIPLIGTEFVPEYDASQYFVSFKAAPGSSLEATSALVEDVEEIIDTYPEVTQIYTTIGSGSNPVNKGIITVKLHDLEHRQRSVGELMGDLRRRLAGYAGLQFSIAREPGHGGSNAPVEISISGDRQEKLIALMRAVEDSVRVTAGAVEVDNSLGEGKPELQLILDRDKIADLGLNVSELALTVRKLINGTVAMRFQEGDRECDVRLRLRESDRDDISDLSRILIPSDKDIVGRDDYQVPLSWVTDFQPASAVSEINRYDRQKTIKVTANNSGRFAGDVRADAFARASQIPTPPGYRIYVSGEGEMQQRSFQFILEALIMSIIFIYLVLASQFESFKDPFTIMLSLPMALIGALGGLLVFGSSLSIMSLIGIVMLMGLVTKNAILLIDFAKQEMKRGTPVKEALIKAGLIRLRPILMTSLSLIFGLMPLAFALGPGAELRAGIARAVIGGMTSSTILTLVIVPVVFSLMDDMFNRLRRIFGRSKQALRHTR
ncbi:MAG: efflux RND transporter permease subunit [candidate division Zixibacteria bacterium]|nr:efflux RND transporter permease subunit [candidate division Zixibacteria bacterium]